MVYLHTTPEVHKTILVESFLCFPNNLDFEVNFKFLHYYVAHYKWHWVQMHHLYMDAFELYGSPAGTQQQSLKRSNTIIRRQSSVEVGNVVFLSLFPYNTCMCLEVRFIFSVALYLIAVHVVTISLEALH